METISTVVRAKMYRPMSLIAYVFGLLMLFSFPSYSQVYGFSTKKITAFQWLRGNTSWQQETYSLLSRSSWTVDDTTGVALMIQPDGYPTLKGSYSVDGKTLTMWGFYQRSTGYTGTVTVEYYAVADFNTSTPTMKLWYVSGSSLSAVINGTGFGSTKVKYYYAKLQLRSFYK
jgi:hypothetical protein